MTAGQVRRGIAVRERAADRAAMPHLRIADQSGGVRDERVVLLDQRVVADVVVPRQRTDRERLARVAHVRQLVEPTDVDEQRRPGEAEPQQREQRMPAREQLCVLREPSSVIACSADSATS